jgi:hypothetical protein
MFGVVSIQRADAVMIHDEPSGFRGNLWGAAPRDCPSLTFVTKLGLTDSKKEVDLYDRSTVGIILNGVSFSRIRYRFIDNKLESVQLSYEGRDNRNRLLQLMEQRFGTLTPGERKQLPGVEWEGFETVVNLSYNPTTEKGSLWFISRALGGGFTSNNASPQGS